MDSLGPAMNQPLINQGVIVIKDLVDIINNKIVGYKDDTKAIHVLQILKLEILEGRIDGTSKRS